jgi:hypothetical protein
MRIVSLAIAVIIVFGSICWGQVNVTSGLAYAAAQGTALWATPYNNIVQNNSYVGGTFNTGLLAGSDDGSTPPNEAGPNNPTGTPTHAESEASESTSIINGSIFSIISSGFEMAGVQSDGNSVGRESQARGAATLRTYFTVSGNVNLPFNMQLSDKRPET